MRRDAYASPPSFCTPLSNAVHSHVAMSVHRSRKQHHIHHEMTEPARAKWQKMKRHHRMFFKNSPESLHCLPRTYSVLSAAQRNGHRVHHVCTVAKRRARVCGLNASSSEMAEVFKPGAAANPSAELTSLQWTLAFRTRHFAKQNYVHEKQVIIAEYAARCARQMQRSNICLFAVMNSTRTFSF